MSFEGSGRHQKLCSSASSRERKFASRSPMRRERSDGGKASAKGEDRCGSKRWSSIRTIEIAMEALRCSRAIADVTEARAAATTTSRSANCFCSARIC